LSELTQKVDRIGWRWGTQAERELKLNPFVLLRHRLEQLRLAALHGKPDTGWWIADEYPHSNELLGFPFAHGAFLLPNVVHERPP